MTLDEKKQWLMERDMGLVTMEVFSLLPPPGPTKLRSVSDIAIKCYDAWVDHSVSPQREVLDRLVGRGTPADLVDAAGEILEIARQAAPWLHADEEFARWTANAKMTVPSSICLYRVLRHVIQRGTPQPSPSVAAEISGAAVGDARPAETTPANAPPYPDVPKTKEWIAQARSMLRNLPVADSVAGVSSLLDECETALDAGEADWQQLSKAYRGRFSHFVQPILASSTTGDREQRCRKLELCMFLEFAELELGTPEQMLFPEAHIEESSSCRKVRGLAITVHYEKLVLARQDEVPRPSTAAATAAPVRRRGPKSPKGSFIMKEDRRANRTWLPQAIVIAMLLWALVPSNPYIYYILLRIVCCGVFAYLAVQAVNRCQAKWAWILGVTAVIYNPILRVHLTREIWSVINLLTVGIAAATILVADTGHSASNMDGGEPGRHKEVPSPPGDKALSVGLVLLGGSFLVGMVWGVVAMIGAYAGFSVPRQVITVIATTGVGGCGLILCKGRFDLYALVMVPLALITIGACFGVPALTRLCLNLHQLALLALLVSAMGGSVLVELYPEKLDEKSSQRRK